MTGGNNMMSIAVMILKTLKGNKNKERIESEELKGRFNLFSESYEKNYMDRTKFSQHI